MSALSPSEMADLTGKELAEHIGKLRKRIEAQSVEWDGLLGIVQDVLEELEERLDVE